MRGEQWVDTQGSVGFNANRRSSINMETAPVAQLSLWVLQFVLSDAFLLMCVMFFIIGLLELAIPAHKIPSRHYRLNLGYAFVNILAVTAVTPIISTGTAYAIQNVGLGLIDLRAFGMDGAVGAVFAMVVGALIFDFFQYWEHRLAHGSKILWQQHLLHHSDEYMNVTTSARQHFLDNFLQPVLVTIPMAILFQLPAVSIGLVSLIPLAWQYLTHANIKLGFGPLWWLLASPNYHRIHHSLEPNHIDKNFVAWFPVWDIVFGTAVVPRRGEYPATGVVGVSVQTLTQAYLLPLVGWRRMLSARLSFEKRSAVRSSAPSRVHDA
jgi:sterol desaturase/sphingolipid hydroxylase (fatty acid hydroxylase superfamily)